MLTFYWRAILKNGKEIPQFDSEGIENSFGLVQLEDQNKNIKQFQLVCSEDGNAHIIIDLETGKFDIRGAVFHPYNSLTTLDGKIHYRVVFYRRNRRDLGANMQPVGEPYIWRYLIGWQCTWNGLNYQRIIFYDPNSGGIEIKAKR